MQNALHEPTGAIHGTKSSFHRVHATSFSPLLGLGLLSLLLVCSGAAAGSGKVHVYPAPVGEELSQGYTVTVEGKSTPAYACKVAPADKARRWKAMDDVAHSGDYFEKGAFAYFDVNGSVTVTVTCPDVIHSAKVLPTSYGIVPKVADKSLTFVLDVPQNLTVEVNGDWVHSLHLFASPFETDVPNVVYFGVGIHEIKEGIKITDGKTLYVAGGAILRGTGPAGGAVVSLLGSHVTLRGRGIIDGTLCPTHSRNLLRVQGSDIRIEGVILRDSSTWNVPIRKSDRVLVKNLKVLGNRANSDGIDVCNSRDVTVDGCFVRTLDDLIVVKSDKGQGEVHHVVVKNCVLWNQLAHALSIGAELRENVDDVLFTNCDIIHDTSREWSLRVFHSDAATISNVRFENIRIEESHKLISLWINKAIWSKDADRGHIRDVEFKNITAIGEPLRIELRGFDPDHAVENVTFENVVLNGKPLSPGDIQSNSFVKQVNAKP